MAVANPIVAAIGTEGSNIADIKGSDVPRIEPANAVVPTRRLKTVN